LFPKLKKERPQPFNTKYRPEGTTTIKAREAREKIREAGAFAKHARHDHDLAYEYNPIFTELYLHCAVMAHTELDDYDMHGLRTIFCLYFGVRWPHLFDF